MELQSVRMLKQQIKVDLSSPLILGRRLRASDRGMGIMRASRHETSGAATVRRSLQPPRLRLGYAPNPEKADDYRLAIRFAATDDLSRLMVEAIAQEARGEVDIRRTGAIRPLQAPWHRISNRPCLIGSSCMNAAVARNAGTLGAVVRARDDGSLHLLSNNHVLARENAGTVGEPIVQPGTLDGGTALDQVGTLATWIELLPGEDARNAMDAAIARFDAPHMADTATLNGIGRLRGTADILEAMAQGNVLPVQKLGRTSGHTLGRVSAFGVDDIDVGYGLGVCYFDDQIEIEGTGEDAFCQPGDSGALVLDMQGDALALLFAGSDEGGGNGKGLTYATPLASVLDGLGVDLVTGG